RVAGLAVPYLADWCSVDVVDPDGSVRRMAVTHADPAKAAIARRIAHYPPDPAGLHPRTQVLRTGCSYLAPDVTEAGLATVTPDAEQLRVMQGLGYRSAIAEDPTTRPGGHRVGRYRFTGGVLAVLACAVFATRASALAPGDFDPSFASGGTFIQPLGEGTRPGAMLNAVAMQADGKIVVTGVASGSKEVVARLNPDGTLDPAFGNGGKVLTTFGTGSSDLPSPQALAIGPDGKIVIGGFVSGRLLLARLNADGSFDAAFGSNGVVVTQLGEGTNPYSGAFAVALQPDGRILTGGGARTSGNHGAVLVARWNTDGSLDSSFGTNGKATPQLGEGANADSGVTNLALQPDGKIVIAGSATDTDATQGDAALVARLDGDGTGLDASFGTGGKVLGRLGLTSSDITRPRGLALQPDGKIVLGGYTTDAQSHQQIFVSRLNVDGKGLDSWLVGGGTLITQLGEGLVPSSELTGLALQPDGKIVGVGDATGPHGDTQVLVARVKADGTLDSAFSGDGKVLTQLAVAMS